MAQSGSNEFQMAPNGNKWLQMAPNGSKWLQIAPYSSTWLQIAPNRGGTYTGPLRISFEWIPLAKRVPIQETKTKSQNKCVWPMIHAILGFWNFLQLFEIFCRAKKKAYIDQPSKILLTSGFHLHEGYLSRIRKKVRLIRDTCNFRFVSFL